MGEAAAEKDFYWKLFKSTFIISAFTIGGGFVIIPLLKAKFVDEYKWMDDKEALSQCGNQHGLQAWRYPRYAYCFAGNYSAAADYPERYFLCL